MSGASVTPNLWDRAKSGLEIVALWGSPLATVARAAYGTSRSSMAISAAIQSLPTSTIIDPLVYTLGAPSLFGLLGIVMVPYNLYLAYQSATATGENWKTKTFNVIKNVGGLGMAVGSIVQTVSFIWAETRPAFSWLPGFQLVAALIAGTDVIVTSIQLHKLKKIDSYLNGITKLEDIPEQYRGNIFSVETAEKYLGVPAIKFNEFKENLKNEPDGGLKVLKGRVKEKLFEQRLRVAAGVISIVALAILTGLAFAPTPVAPVALIALTITAYCLSGTASVLGAMAIWSNVKMISPSFSCTMQPTVKKTIPLFDKVFSSKWWEKFKFAHTHQFQATAVAA